MIIVPSHMSDFVEIRVDFLRSSSYFRGIHYFSDFCTKYSKTRETHHRKDTNMAVVVHVSFIATLVYSRDEASLPLRRKVPCGKG